MACFVCPPQAENGSRFHPKSRRQPAHCSVDVTSTVFAERHGASLSQRTKAPGEYYLRQEHAALQFTDICRPSLGEFGQYGSLSR